MMQAPGASASPLADQVHLLALGGMVEFAKGRLHAAKSLIHQALARAEPGGKPIPFVDTLMAYMAASLVLYEQDALAQTESYLTRCEAQAVKFGSAEVQVFALSGLARLALTRDDLAAAAHYYAQVDTLLQTHTSTSLHLLPGHSQPLPISFDGSQPCWLTRMLWVPQSDEFCDHGGKFYVIGQYTWLYIPGAIASSIFYGWVYNATGGSVLLPHDKEGNPWQTDKT